MTKSLLKEKFGRLGPIRAVVQNQSGLPGVVSLRPKSGLQGLETIPAIQALHKRGMSMLRAKRAIEGMVRNGHAVTLVPKIEDVRALARDLLAHGVSTSVVAAEEVDIRDVRQRIGLSQEEFAQRYGLDLDSLQNWETGRRVMPKAVQSYVRVIRNLPQQVSEALEEAILQP